MKAKNIHYHAFISYRHAPRDTEVAAHLQRALETYRIPWQVRKSLGIKPIGSIFRDKEELPATSDLRHTIAVALENSDYLIVVCSPNTVHSDWVRWEIDTFLKTHDLDRVLTVIAEGDPLDVIPSRLRSEGKEPLASNYLDSFKEADKIELPRLAAAILGCPYALLMHRKRLYALRRLSISITAGLLLSLAISFYMAASRSAIQESYREALKSQARSLASESQDLLSGYDFITAASLALAALPSSEKPDIPVTSQAQSALTEAVSAYHVNELALAYTFAAKDTVTDYEFSAGGKYLLAMDESNFLSVFRCATGEEVYSGKIMVESALAGFIPLGDDRVILWNGSQIRCLNYLEDTLLWETEMPEGDISCLLSQDSPSFLILGSEEAFLLDSQTGAVLAETSLEGQGLLGEAGAPALFAGDCAVYFFCENQREAGPLEEGRAAPLRLARWEAKTGALRLLPGDFEDPAALCLTGETLLLMERSGNSPQDGADTVLYPAPMRLYALSAESEEILWSQELMGSTYRNEVCLFPLSYEGEGGTVPGVMAAFSSISCLFSLETGELLSQAPLSGSVLGVLTYSARSVTYVADNGRILVHDFASGTSQVQATLSSAVTQARSIQEEGPTLLPRMALCSGENLLYYAHLSDYSAQREASLEGTPFRRMVHTEGGAVLQNSAGNTLTFLLPGTGEKASVSTLTLFSTEDATQEQKDVYLVGAEDDLSQAYCIESDASLSHRLLAVRPSGSVDLGELTGLTTDLLVGRENIPYADFTDGILTLCDMSRNALYRRNVQTGEETLLPLTGLSPSQELLYLYFNKPDQSSYLVPSPVVLSPRGDAAFVTIYDGEYDCCFGALADLETGEVTLLEAADLFSAEGEETEEETGEETEKSEEKEAEETVVPEEAEEEALSPLEAWVLAYPVSDMGVQAAFSQNGSFLALLCEEHILLWTREGSLLGEIPLTAAKNSFCFFENTLLVCTGSTLNRYSLTGELLGATRLLKGHGTAVTGLLLSPAETWEFYQDLLFLGQDGQMYILGTEEWEESSLGTVGGYLFYDAAQNRFYTYDAVGKSITSYLRHDLSELITMGRLRLGGQEMDESVKLTFSIP